jgi:type II secretory pathway pseudopilin PulG
MLVVIALISILAALLLPALNKAKARAQAIACLNNTRQLGYAWILYANDNQDRLAYNLGSTSRQVAALRTNLNWVNNIMSWELDSDNTNTATITEAALGQYANRSTSIYRCPSDFTLSSIQKKAGWKARVRSYSMNMMVGDAGELTRSGYNLNNPGYVQFFKMNMLPRPAEIFVFLDEHPDSINDGYFLNRPADRAWTDLPGSYHEGGAALSFGDGHSQLKKWTTSSTLVAARPDAAELPMSLGKGQYADFRWVLEHMSVDRPGSATSSY